MPTNQARTDTVRRSRDSKMSDHQLVGFLGRKIYQAMNDEDGDLSDTRQDSFDRYLGDAYGNERDGYSKYVTREVLETVEWVLPSVLRVFLGSDKVVTFDAVGAEDEDQADQETDVVNHTIMKANNGDGFLALHHFFKDALLYPNAYIKAYVEEQEKTTIHTAKGIDQFGLLMIAEDEDNEIIEQDSYFIDVPMPMEPEIPMPPGSMGAQPPGAPPAQPPGQPPQQPMGAPGMPPQSPPGPMGAPPQPQPGGPAQQPPLQAPPGAQQMPMPGTHQMEVFDIKYRRTTSERKIRIDPIPGEEALIDNDCVSTNIDTADFSCHRVRKSFTQLVQEGFDREKLERVGTYEDFQWNDERTNRLFYEDEDPDAEDEDDPSMRQFWVHECVAYVDYDGDGVAEMRKITLIGTTVFVNEITDYQQMVAMSAILIPHKHNGMSYADIVKDLQELRTTLTRQMLDNIYKINIRRKVISEDSFIQDGTTLEAMLNVQAEWIPVRGPAHNAIAPEQTQSMTSEILPVLQHLDERTANRTGVNPQVNLNADVLQQSTMGAFMGALEQASQRVEMLVRIFAETGMKQLMRKIHHLTRSYPDIATTVKIRNQWIEVDPEAWRDRADMTVNVGLGFNNQQQMVGLLVQLLEIQQQAAPQGLAGEREIYNTFEKLIESAGLGDASQYFKDPGAPGWQPPQPPPDPQGELLTAQAQALQQEQQRKMQDSQQEGQFKQAKLQTDSQINMQKAQLDQQTKMQEMQIKERELELKEQELALKEREIELQYRLKDAETVAQVRNTNADTDLKDEMAIKTRVEGMVADKNIDKVEKELKADDNKGDNEENMTT